MLKLGVIDLVIDGTNKPQENGGKTMYKNWKVICGIRDCHFRWAMALLDLTSDLGKRLISQLPEYFTAEQLAGPVPLSILRHLARQNALEQGATERSMDCLVSFDECWQKEYDIPIMTYSTIADSEFDNIPMFPEEISQQMDKLGRRVEVGDVFTHAGKQLVVLENNDEHRGSCFLMFFAPAEHIAVDL